MKTKRPRAHRRRVFTAGLAHAGEFAILDPGRGCWTRTTDGEGNVLADIREPGRSLVANIGDRLIVTHTDLAVDELAAVEVVSVYPDGQRLCVATVCGAMPSSRRVHVLPAAKAKAV